MYFDFSKTDYFERIEFDSPDIYGSGKLMKSIFMEQLVKARKLSKVPFIIKSGLRSEYWNKKVGGTLNSSHLFGIAADIQYLNSFECFIIIDSLLKAGFTRIGLGKGFIHVDSSKTKPNEVLFNYYK